MSIVAAALIGLVAGIASGMLGIGGGTITIPGMVILLDIEQHTAQGVSLGAMLLTALIGSSIHYRQGNVNLKIVLWLAPAAAVFSLLGAWVAGIVAAEWLTRIFAIFLLAVGGRMLLFHRGGQGANAS